MGLGLRRPRCPGGLTLRSLIQEHAEPARLVDVARAYPISRRVVYRACRLGRIPGAVRVARRWLAPLDAIETWLQAQGPRPDAVEDEGDELDELRAALAKGVRYNRSAAQHWSPLRGPLRSSAAGPALQSNPTAARAPPSHRSVTVHVSALGGAISWCVAYPRGPGEVDGQGKRRLLSLSVGQSSPCGLVEVVETYPLTLDSRRSPIDCTLERRAHEVQARHR